jgi:hypothetical protein
MKRERIRLRNIGRACACKYLEPTNFQLFSLGLSNFKTAEMWRCSTSTPLCAALQKCEKERYQREDLDVGGRIILSRVAVTKDGVRVGNRIY